jgi:RNA polymerase sigma-70 factor (ECF subfamily)
MAILKHKYKKFGDEKLMECIQRGDTSAFNEIYNRYSKRLLFYFFRELAGDQEKAQDFLQDIFLKIVEKPDSFCTERRFSTWIFAVAYNMCKNEYRRLGVESVVDSTANMDGMSLDIDSDYHQLERNMDQKTFESALTAELEKIDDGHRSAFLLRFQQNLSIKEIGEILGCSEGTVKSRLFYTTQKLATKLKAFNLFEPEVPKDERIK